MENELLSKRIKALREERGWLQKDVAGKLNVKSNTLSGYENGTRSPDPGMLIKISELYDVSADYLLGQSSNRERNWENELPALTEKDERDIKKDLENMLKNLSSENGYAAFDGRSIDELNKDDKELLIHSLENSLRLAKRIAKQKFTPKKYRD